MIAALALALTVQLPLGPVVPAGSNRAFHAAVLAVEDHLQGGNFDAAKRMAAVLPQRKFKLQWDDAKVPAAYRASFAAARDAALKEWSMVLLDVEPKIVPSGGDLKISFEQTLPENQDGIPQGATFSPSPDPVEPRLHAVLALQRGRPGQPTTALDVRNEVLFAIGSYLGLERTHFAGTAASRTDLPTLGQARAGQNDIRTANKNLEITDRLLDAIAKKTRLEAARPQLQLDAVRVELPPATQGETVKFSIQVTNSGNAPLDMRFIPDCGCLGPTYPPRIDAGRSAVVSVNVDTVNFVGELRHRLYVYSNDAEFPFRDVPVSIDVEPLFRFFRTGPGVIQMTDQGADTEVFLVLSDKANFKLSEPALVGVTGSAKMTPWEGEVALDGKPKRKFKGYKLNVHLDRSPALGRISANIDITTDHDVFRILRHSLQAQRGILVLPESLYLGEIARAPMIAAFLVSRPGIPFKIVKIESDHPSLKATAREQGDSSEYRVSVEYDGKSDFGMLNATLTIHTNDPKQPKVYANVRGLIR